MSTRTSKEFDSELELGVSGIEKNGEKISSLKSERENRVRDLTEALSNPILLGQGMDAIKSKIDEISNVDGKIKQLIITPYNVYLLLKHFFVYTGTELEDIDYLMEDGASCFKEFYEEGLGKSNLRIDAFKSQISLEYGEEYGNLMPQTMEEFENIILPFRLSGDTQKRDFYTSLISGQNINYDGQELLLGDEHREKKGKMEAKLAECKSLEESLRDLKSGYEKEYENRYFGRFIQQRNNRDSGVVCISSDFSELAQAEADRDKYVKDMCHDQIQEFEDSRKKYDELFEDFYRYEREIIENKYPYILESYDNYIGSHPKNHSRIH